MNDADYVYRVSLKCFIKNEREEVLVVRETGRDWWDLPGGGMNHREDIKTAIAREMVEEVQLTGAFTYRIVAVDNPGILQRNGMWQLRLIFAVEPRNMMFKPGADGDEIAFMNPNDFQNSPEKMERLIYNYNKLLS